MAGGAYNLEGGVPKEEHRPEPSNIETHENRLAAARRAQGGVMKYPMHVHKPNGLVREVNDDAQLADALAKGWHEDIRDVPAEEPTTAPDRVSQMTIAQAKAHIAAAPITELAAIEQDETLHANRAEVLKFIADAKDAAGGKPAKAAATKAVKTPKKK